MDELRADLPLDGAVLVDGRGSAGSRNDEVEDVAEAKESGRAVICPRSKGESASLVEASVKGLVPGLERDRAMKDLALASLAVLILQLGHSDEIDGEGLDGPVLL